MTDLLQAWLSLQALAVAGSLLALGVSRLPVAPADAVRAVRAAVVLTLLLPLAVLAPVGAPYRPPPQVFSAPIDGSLSIGAASAPPAIAADQLDLLALAVAGLLALAVARTARDAWQLGAIVRRAPVLHRVGGVEVRLSAEASSPFAVALPGRAVVVLDPETAAHPADRLVALRHELQHHRAGDPTFAWIGRLLAVLSAGNPLVPRALRELQALEELACDAAVLRRTPARAYADCLLRAARRAPARPLTAGLTASLLHRRITMLTRPALPHARWLPVALAAALATTAWASSGLVDRATPDLTEIARRASGPDLVVPDEDVVRDALAELTASPARRAHLRGALERMADHAPLVDGALDDYGLPRALAAVPIVESGYENLGDGAEGLSYAPGIPGKGLWMFIPATARAYGLRVDDEVDERLDLVLETDAAMRLLSDLHAELGDWGLALAGYNQGAEHVREAIAREGTRDPWELVRRGALNEYAPMVMAAVLVVEEPALAR